LKEVFSDPHVKAREMVIEMDHKKTGKAPLKLIANPIKMNDTPPSYRLSPPLLGEHTDEVLSEVLGLSEDEIKKLKNEGVI
jgi:crotonobetainyl-CoA:carnitine CoA-transferase CaiB-like acyl-CoA transferase